MIPPATLVRPSANEAASQTPEQALRQVPRETARETERQMEGPMARATPKETVMAFYEAFDRGDLRRFDAIGTPFEARVFGATVLDWPGFLAFGEAFREAFPDGQHVFDFVVAEGGSVATIGRCRGRHTRPFMGVAPTHRQVDFTVMHVDRVQDGRIVEHRGMGDSQALWSQLGVEPPR